MERIPNGLGTGTNGQRSPEVLESDSDVGTATNEKTVNNKETGDSNNSEPSLTDSTITRSTSSISSSDTSLDTTSQRECGRECYAPVSPGTATSSSPESRESECTATALNKGLETGTFINGENEESPPHYFEVIRPSIENYEYDSLSHQNIGSKSGIKGAALDNVVFEKERPENIELQLTPSKEWHSQERLATTRPGESDGGGNTDRKPKTKDDQRKRSAKCKCCSWFGRHFQDFVHGPPEDYMLLKVLLGFPFGAIFGFGLYVMIIEPMSLPLATRQIVGGALSIGLATGFALSVQVRCVTLLLVPMFFGKKGRSYVGTFAITYLIIGPVSNIILNGKEVTRSLSCAAELVLNHTMSKWELRLKPVGDILVDIQKEGFMMSKITRKIHAAFQPMVNEVHGTSETKEMKTHTAEVDKMMGGDRVTEIEEQEPETPNMGKDDVVEKRYRKKLDYRCEDVWNSGVLGCRNHFKSLESKCLDAIPIIGYILCLPLKLTFFCEFVKLIPGAVGVKCESEDIVNPGFGETYDATDEMIEDMDRNSEINLQYKLVRTPEDIDVTSVEEVRESTMREFEQKQAWVQFIMTLMKRFLAFTFLLVFIGAYSYNKKFLTDFQFDNMYITRYFRHIDSRRKKQGKKTLLPLKKTESQSVIFPTKLKMTKAEKKKIGKSTFLIIVRGLTAWLVIVTDHLLFTIMDIIRSNSRIDYRQTGEHHIRVNINGTGFMSDIVRLFLKSFDKKHSIDHVTTNFDCLPQPAKLDPHYVTMIYCVYAIVWLLTFFEAYGLRLRRLIASFFYRKREKRRVLFFYNDMLKKRKGFLRHVRHQVRKQARSHQLTRTTSLLQSFRKHFPRLCACLKVLEKTKDSCLICNDKARKDFHYCQTPGCKFGYCAECWLDVKKICYACAPEDAFDDQSELTDDDFSTDT